MVRKRLGLVPKAARNWRAIVHRSRLATLSKSVPALQERSRQTIKIALDVLKGAKKIDALPKAA